MDSETPIITLEYKPIATFGSLILLIIGIGMVAYDYEVMIKTTFPFLLIFLGIWLFFFSKTTYKLYDDKIVRTNYGFSTTLQINTTSLCYEYRPKTTKNKVDKPSNEFYIKTEAPIQQFKIYDFGWKNYPVFREEVRKTIIAKAATTLKEKKIFNQRVLTSTKEVVKSQRQIYNTIGIVVGAILFLVGIVSLLRFLIFEESLGAELFLSFIGFVAMIYYAIFNKGYD